MLTAADISLRKARVTEEFRSRCCPSPTAVYGCQPKLGESVASFSGSYPLPLCRHVAAGSLQAHDALCAMSPLSAVLLYWSAYPRMSLSYWRTCLMRTVSPGPSLMTLSGSTNQLTCFPFARSSAIGYRFVRQIHINVQETARARLGSSTCASTIVLMDSRVLVGASSIASVYSGCNRSDGVSKGSFLTGRRCA